jgi:hypothetical protein
MSRWGQRFVISPSSRMDAELWSSNSRVGESIAGFPKRIAGIHPPVLVVVDSVGTVLCIYQPDISRWKGISQAT